MARLRPMSLPAVLACLTLSACGSSSSSSSTTAKTTSTASAAASAASTGHGASTGSGASAARSAGSSSVAGARFRQALSSFAACLSRNGVKLPSASGSHGAQAFSLKGVDTKSASYRKALVACRPVLTAAFRSAANARSKPASPSAAGSPAGGPGAGGSPGASGSARIPPVKVPPRVTAIMSRFTACMRTNGVAGFPEPQGASFNLSGTHLDPHSPQYKTAEARCNSILQALDSQG